MHDLAPHPGNVLLRDFMQPRGLTGRGLAKAMGLKDGTLINGVLRQERSITAAHALRLARALGTSPEFWLDLQRDYDLGVAAIENGGAFAAIKVIPRSEDDDQMRGVGSTRQQRSSGSSARADQRKAPTAKLAYTVAEAVALLPWKKTKVYELIRSGELPSRLKFNRRYVMHEDLVALLLAGPVDRP
ncbi:MAG TPA: HigA family addiction module antitoxin [Phenylobacterium sp.]|nr:HigA family addiction module antitoxin [Phenylobacterium sp.]